MTMSRRVGVLIFTLKGLQRTKMSKVFKTGDLVKFSDGGGEVGLVVSRVRALMHYTSPQPEDTDLYEILLNSGKTISVHKMYPEKVGDHR